MEIDLATARTMYNSGDSALCQIAIDNFPITDLDPDYHVPGDDKPKYDVKKHLPTTYNGAIAILGSITRVGPIMSTSSCYVDEIKSSAHTGWAEHIFAPDYKISEQLVFLSNALMLMHAWWAVDSDYSQDSNTKGYAIARYKDTITIRKVEGKDYKNALFVFSTEEIARKFLSTFNELMHKIIKYITAI